MDAKDIWGALSVAAALASYLAYFRSIYRGQTRPHLFSWVVWSLISGIVAAAQFAEGAGAGAWSAMAATFLSLWVCRLSFSHGEKTITRTDWVSLLGAFCAIPLWVAAATPLWSVLLLSLIYALGFYPTFRKSWGKPRSENLSAISINYARQGFTLLAIETLNVTTVFYPATWFVLNSAFIGMCLWRRQALKSAPAY